MKMSNTPPPPPTHKKRLKIFLGIWTIASNLSFYLLCEYATQWICFHLNSCNAVELNMIQSELVRKDSRSWFYHSTS